VLTRFSRHAFFSVLCLLLALPAAAQTTSRITLDASETVFSVLAAIGNCGYDSASTDPVHTQVETALAKAVGASKQAQAASSEMCAFYRDHQQPDSARDLAQYVSLALNLGEPPKFPLKVKESDLPPDANYVLSFVPLLVRFAEATHLHHIWEEHRYQYEELLARFHDQVSNALLATDIYLRLPISGYVGRAFTVYLDPMAAAGQVNARNYGADYFMVASPAGDSLRLDAVRHTYLHFILDPLILKRAHVLKRMAPLLKTVQDAPLEDSYKKDISLLVTESLIRAVEARLAAPPARAAAAARGRNAEPLRRREADKAMSEGFVLTPYFFEQLAKFENEPVGLRDALPDWLYYLDVGREVKRAENAHFGARSAAEVVARSKPQPGLLDLAEQRLASGDYDGAHNLAQRALDQKQDDPGRALFILARAATMNHDMSGAREYFQRTAQVARDPRLRAWAHIYLGRISDLQDNRDAALEQYKAALAAGDTTPETRAAAERGLKEPYQPRPQSQ
jgi:tetratricopeptide (TPR) repeat protein